MKKIVKFLWLLPVLSLVGCSSDEPFGINDDASKIDESVAQEMLVPGDMFDLKLWLDGEYDPFTEPESKRDSIQHHEWERNTVPLKLNIIERYWEHKDYEGRLHYNVRRPNDVGVSLCLLRENVSRKMPLEFEGRDNIRIAGLQIQTVQGREMKHDGDIPLETEEEFLKDRGWDKPFLYDTQVFEKGEYYVEIPEVGYAELKGNTLTINPYLLEGIDRVIWKTTSPHILFARIVLEADPTANELNSGIQVARAMVEICIY